MSKLLMLVAALLVACVDENDEPQFVSFSPVDSKIIIEARELLSEDAKSVSFHCRTEKIYSCSNFKLLTEQKVDKNSVRITFTSVGEQRICLTSLGPATAQVDLGPLPHGVYALELNTENATNKGTLHVTDTEVTFALYQEVGIEIVRPTTQRVPQNTYWGRIGYNKESSSGLVDAFLEKLAAAGAEFNKQAPGHYYYYEIDSAGEIIADTQHSGRRFVKAFIFQYEGNESALSDLIQTDEKNYGDALSIRVETFRGEVL